ncbi:hypothetical protein KAJ83_03885 [Marivibrio halodurans]|uniref:Uncharacterized protein n=1 Tax=Marivibrio halodurans TaxID=2039722 RepID=A0A8J7V1I4_9PROT|nr:hypothetical protein [Marivibrio halodurans]MBP5856136.1 hypothetical protein [Marivibrio halodurans]
MGIPTGSAARTTLPLRAILEGAARAEIPLVRDTVERTRSPDPERAKPAFGRPAQETT